MPAICRLPTARFCKKPLGAAEDPTRNERKRFSDNRLYGKRPTRADLHHGIQELGRGIRCRAAHREARKLGKLINRLKDEGKSIAGYGAAAKGFSVLKLAEIDGSHLDYFVDDSPAKQGKVTPATHIPIISRAEAEANLPDYFMITAPNYETHIVDKEGTYRDGGGKFITCDSRIV